MLASGSRRRENQTHERSAGLQIPQGKPAPGHERRHLSEPIWTGSGRKRNLAAAARGDTERSRISPTSRPAPQPQPGPCPPTAQMKAAPQIPPFLLLGGREETLLLGNNLRRSGALLWGKTGAGPKDGQTDTARTPRCCRGRPWMAPALHCLGRKVSEPLRPAASMQAFGSAVAVGSIKANCFLFQTIKKALQQKAAGWGRKPFTARLLPQRAPGAGAARPVCTRAPAPSWPHTQDPGPVLGPRCGCSKRPHVLGAQRQPQNEQARSRLCRAALQGRSKVRGHYSSPVSQLYPHSKSL